MPDTYPLCEDKYRHTSIASARHHLEHMREAGAETQGLPPAGVVICYQRKLWEHLCSRYPPAPWAGQVRGVSGLRVFEADGVRLGAIGGFGIGAPAAAYVLEHLIAFGVQRFVSLGIVGSLQADVDIGDIVVCDRALRDEGTSYHYAAPSRYAQADPALSRHLQGVLERRGEAHAVGASWTMDAIYRETEEEVRRYQAEGVLTVDMEAAALFAVAACRGVQLGCLFCISDTLADFQWNPQLGSGAVHDRLVGLFEVAVDALATFPGESASA